MPAFVALPDYLIRGFFLLLQKDYFASQHLSDNVLYRLHCSGRSPVLYICPLLRPRTAPLSRSLVNWTTSSMRSRLSFWHPVRRPPGGSSSSSPRTSVTPTPGWPTPKPSGS